MSFSATAGWEGSESVLRRKNHQEVPNPRTRIVIRSKILLANFRDAAMDGDMKRGISMLLAGICSILGSRTSAAESLEIGKALPEVEGKNHKGETVKLHEAAAKGLALFFFYPKAATPG